MPALTTEQTTEVTIEPALRVKLVKELRAYAKQKDLKDAAEAAMDKLKVRIADLRDETGETSVSVDGYSVTLVAPLKSTFNKKLFVSNGGDLDIYNQSFEDKPVKAYTKITVPQE